MAGAFTSGTAYQRVRTGAADQVLQDLRDQILSGALARGTRLPSEKELAAHYEVSAPTVREAIRALSAMNLVAVRHGAGTYVTAETSSLMSSAIDAVVELERVTLPDLFDLSEAIYRKAAENYLQDGQGRSLSALRAAAEAFTADMGDEELPAALHAFLTELVALSGNQLLIAIAGHLIEVQIAAARRSAERSPDVWSRIAVPLRDERLAIVEALEREDAAAADTAIRAYMKRGRELVSLHAADAAEERG
ncbi:FadR/GntR family transcriptional regulator [Actinacidiphila guanduensis]|uniref:DNA-binding transcriptional regulator, FadR family n=1 Tax=Actinacidiphila guanduensis TaxID=310781 RepID=A0A1H0QK66_9ACTN|nr:GntR family transcriptional regulator [Actinacidiphila guanduensis]SDP17590.1 DNA-binding transcriptional regulator, FadR family [Actinacidiphila guanduensis]